MKKEERMKDLIERVEKTSEVLSKLILHTVRIKEDLKKYFQEEK